MLVIRLRQPVEAVVTPVADAYVSTAHRDANYGTEPTLRADATPKIRSYLRFRLPESSGRIVRAELRLWSRSGDLAGYSVHPVTSSSWVEGDITARIGPAAAPPVARSGPFGPGSWTSVDVARLLDDPHQLSVVVTTLSRHNITFDSREGPNRPQLVIWTKPAPGPSAMPLRLRR
ncbi:MAG TPA: DNRLRE domain-containing protein [Actinomycetota bacterium]